eukprot:COSAG01_NODE_2310_length_7942_cov_7.405330_12_plen_111_part_00
MALAKVQPGFSGSAQYWPDVTGQKAAVTGCPDLTVSLLSEEQGPHFTTRRLLIERDAVGGSRPPRQRAVRALKCSGESVGFAPGIYYIYPVDLPPFARGRPQVLRSGGTR